MTRALLVLLVALAALSAFLALASPARADEPAMGPAMDASSGMSDAPAGMDDGKEAWKSHPGAAVAAGFGIALLGLLGFVGLGCAVAVLGAVFPGITATADRTARTTGTGWAYVVGSLVLIGSVLAVGGAAASHHPVLVGIVVLFVVLPAFLLTLAGALATLPLLGERLLGSRGADRSPLSRSVVAAVALGIGSLPGLVQPHVFAPISVLVAFTAFGWPLGVGLSMATRRKAAAPTPPAPQVETPPV